MVYAIFILPGYLEESHQRLEKHMERHMPLIEQTIEEKTEAAKTNKSDDVDVAEPKKMK